MEMVAKHVRPLVYADAAGTEFRCVDGEIQLRLGVGEAEEPSDRQFSPPVNTGNGAEYIGWLARGFPGSVLAAATALANPMTAAHAAADDELLSEGDDA